MAEQAQFQRARARELGISIGTLSPGPLNTITDVAGVRVGHVTLVRGSGPLVRGVGPVRTGVTALLPHGDNLFTSKVLAASTAQRIPHDSTPLTHSMTVLNEQHPAIDALFAAVVETTEEAVINALFAARNIDGRDARRVDALPVDEAITILQQWRRGM
jgi:L-aminopeptidase/D-esterase-like protein